MDEQSSSSSATKNERIKLVEINSYLTCYLCKGYLIDATTISECLHSFCRSCIIKFLQDNSHCPVCEVMINKAKPNIKLDKTLQDIVYKLVPELFLHEMRRRQRFYRNHPVEAAQATPEERGEDTERTIFSPSDTISLSIEYISDDSTPGAIDVQTTNVKNGTIGSTNGEQDSPIKRFLQCPGMCRVDVLKKFVRNKYNVDTNRFYIDILYKKVPLPDHYTLIDIAYIYSWKRNEPMKFFFRITDINKVTERFDYLGPKLEPEKSPPVNREVKPVKTVRFSITEKKNRQSPPKKKVDVSVDTKEITEIKNRIQKEPLNEKRSLFTNITLNKSNDVEIITKIQKVSNKNGQPIGLNIIKQTVKKPKAKESKPEEVKKEEKNVEVSPPEPILPAPVPMEIDVEKSNFLKSIELTARTSLPAVSPEKVAALETAAKTPPFTPEASTSSSENQKAASSSSTLDNQKAASSEHKKVPPSSSSEAQKVPASIQPQKRKNPSPVKTDKPLKKSKVLKLKSSIQNPAVRQIVSNVNQSASNVTKLVERNNSASSKDLQTLFGNCKINIPSSLSITLKESDSDSSERSNRTFVPVKPVQNYIEILRLPDSDSAPSTNNKEKTRSPQTFQKMFEETIKKPEFRKLISVPRLKKEQKIALDLSGDKRNTEVKKPKVVEDKSGKVAVPRKNSPTTQQTIDCHSPSLGMNYKVSVGQNGTQPANKVVSSVSTTTVSPPNRSLKSISSVLPKPTSSLSITTTTTSTPTTATSSLSPNHLLEKYNIQNLAQLTASFNLNPTNLVMSQAGQHLAALQQAMILKHFEMQNHQNWLNMNPSPLVQYEKYLQSLQGQQQHLVGKEN